MLFSQNHRRYLVIKVAALLDEAKTKDRVRSFYYLNYHKKGETVYD